MTPILRTMMATSEVYANDAMNRGNALPWLELYTQHLVQQVTDQIKSNFDAGEVDTISVKTWIDIDYPAIIKA